MLLVRYGDMTFVLKSPTFSYGEEMPSRYTCEGANVSPPLRFAPPRIAVRGVPLPRGSCSGECSGVAHGAQGGVLGG